MAADEIAELETDIRMLEERQREDPSSMSREIDEAIRWRQERLGELRGAMGMAEPPPAPPAYDDTAPPEPAARSAPPPPAPPVASGGGGGGGGERRGGGSKRLSQDQIHELFDYYCNFGRSSVMGFQDTIDSFMFMKFSKECPKLLGKDLTRTDIDLIFTKAKPKLERRLKFEHFLDALAAIAEKKYPTQSPVDGLRALVANHLSPQYEMVQDEIMKTGDTEVPLSGVFERLYDVRNYTGVYAERFRSGDGRINSDADNRIGRSYVGNTNTGTDEVIHDISVLMRPNLRRGGGTMSRKGKGKDGSGQGAGGVDGRGRKVTPQKRRPQTLAEAREMDERRAARGGDSTFTGGSVISGRSTGTMSRRTPHHSSSAGAVASGGAGPPPSKEELEAAMAEARAGKPEKLMSLTMSMASASGVTDTAAPPPAASASAPVIPAASVPVAGGPSAEEAAKAAAEIEELEQDIRILKERQDTVAATPSPSTDELAELGEAISWREERVNELAAVVRAADDAARAARAAAHTPSRASSGGAAPRSAGGAGRTPGSVSGASSARAAPSHPVPASLNQDQLHELFEYYANFGRTSVQSYQDTIDSFMFMKFAKECPGLLSRSVNRTDIDLIFTKAKPKLERRLKFEHFLDALAAVAEKKYPTASPADGLRQLLRTNLAPLYAHVQDELLKTGDSEVPLSGVFERLYDVRNYTGVYAERFRSGDGRINSDADNRVGRSYVGNTNTGTDEVIHDISVLMRPNLRRGGGTMSRKGKGKDGSGSGSTGVDGRGRALTPKHRGHTGSYARS